MPPPIFHVIPSGQPRINRRHVTEQIDEFLHRAYILPSVILLHQVEKTIANILGMTNDKEQKRHFLKPTCFNKESSHPNHCIVLVVTGAVVHYEDSVLRRALVSKHEFLQSLNNQ